MNLLRSRILYWQVSESKPSASQQTLGTNYPVSYETVQSLGLISQEQRTFLRAAKRECPFGGTWRFVTKGIGGNGVSGSQAPYGPKPGTFTH